MKVEKESLVSILFFLPRPQHALQHCWLGSPILRCLLMRRGSLMVGGPNPRYRLTSWENREGQPAPSGPPTSTGCSGCGHRLCQPPSTAMQVPLLQGLEGQLLIKFQLGLPLVVPSAT